MYRPVSKFVITKFVSRMTNRHGYSVCRMSMDEKPAALNANTEAWNMWLNVTQKTAIFGHESQSHLRFPS